MLTITCALEPCVYPGIMARQHDMVTTTLLNNMILTVDSRPQSQNTIDHMTRLPCFDANHAHES